MTLDNPFEARRQADALQAKYDRQRVLLRFWVIAISTVVGSLAAIGVIFMMSSG